MAVKIPKLKRKERQRYRQRQTDGGGDGGFNKSRKLFNGKILNQYIRSFTQGKILFQNTRYSVIIQPHFPVLLLSEFFKDDNPTNH